MNQLELTFILVVVFQIKHFLADFPLQSDYMLGKGNAGWSFILPLTAHCTVHSVLSFAVVLTFNPALWWLGFFDFAIHFVMDRIKGNPRWLGRFRSNNWKFWAAFGLDQMVHHLTHLYMIWVMVTA